MIKRDDWKSAIRTKAEFEKEIEERRKKYKVSGIFFNQFSPQTIQTNQKYSNFYTDANTITLDTIEPLFLHICYDRSDFKKQTKKIPKYYLFLDEKTLNDHFFMGGILIHEEHLNLLYQAILFLKKMVLHKNGLFVDTVHDYYIKGEGDQLFYNEVKKSFLKYKFNKEMSFEKWRIFGKTLESFHNQYTFHYSIVNEKIYKSHEDKLKKSMENLILSLKGFHFDDLEIVCDYINPTDEDIIQKVINSSLHHVSHERISFKVVEKNDRSSYVDSTLLQYVDMCVYAFSRFVSPNFIKKKNMYSILADFEIYKYKKPVPLLSIDPVLIEQFDIIKNIYYNFTFSTLYDLYPAYSDQSNSSVIYSGDNDDVNFGKTICYEIRKFCSRESGIYEPDSIFTGKK